ncbi:MAG TPA: GNAT family protein [Candidatus Saccharimonadia bacterium]|nr:GNAT family protein [Candidatus Saccharimonadia bacterium]
MSAPREPTLGGDGFVLRPFRSTDLDELVALADNERVSAMLRDRFPFPYTRADGVAFLADTAGARDDWRLAIEVDRRFAGSVGFRPGSDVHRHTAEVGYWLGEPYWGRGLVTAALRAATPVAMDALKLHRVAAGVYSGNPASARVLEKAGYEHEGTLRCAVVKRGRLHDVELYARVRRSLADAA